MGKREIPTPSLDPWYLHQAGQLVLGHDSRGAGPVPPLPQHSGELVLQCLGTTVGLALKVGVAG